MQRQPLAEGDLEWADVLMSGEQDEKPVQTGGLPREVFHRSIFTAAENGYGKNQQRYDRY